MSEETRPPTKGYRDVLVTFVNSPNPTRYRVYESMYDRAKDVFYNSASTFRYIVAYEWYVETARDGIDYWVVSPEKSYLNMENICSLRVIGKGNG